MAAAVHPPHIAHQDTPTSSPKDVKKSLMKQEEASRHASPHQSNQGSRQNSPPQPVQPPEAAPTSGVEGGKKETTNAQPLGPPPKPAASGADLDYFSGQHGTTFQTESNPFENAFGGASGDTPGKSLLPPVASLTSPSTLLPGGTPGWSDSLRSGPLSPAMLPGPSGGTDYFGQNFRGSFPTPNESSLRTGLTPGGGGSMFPAPSPNSQLLGLLGSGGITPGFSDFHRTAVSAAAKQSHNNVTSNGQNHNPDANNQFAQEESKPAAHMPTTTQPSDPFSQQASNEAAYGLHMLTQAATGRNGNYGGMQNQPSNIQTNNGMMGGQSQDTSPLSRRGNNKNSVGSMNSGSVETGNASETGESEQTKPTTRSRGGKKGGATNGKAANNRRKAEETPGKAPASKKARANSGGPMSSEDMDDDEDDMGQMDTDSNGKKMTDEEKRKNFLERNRVAALKCRQRKKQWLQNLQNKVEIYSAENDALSSQVQGLREEIVNLKTLLLAHKDCPVASSQGLQGVNMHQFLEQSSHQHANPYGLGMPNGMQMQGMGMGPGPMQQPQRT